MSQNDPGQDLRQHARFELLEYALVREPGKNDPVRSVVIDVSLGGLQVRSRYQFPVGDTVTLNIGRLSSDPIVIQAEVRYSVPIEDSDLFATGFRCLPSSAGQKMEWVDYVHQVFQAQGEQLAG
jgi:hypothetical protein